jgi:membrane-associated protein
VPLGYWFGNVGWVQRNFGAVVMGIIALSVSPIVIEWLRHRLRSAKRA